MVSRVDWAEFVPLITSESSLEALWLSLRTPSPPPRSACSRRADGRAPRAPTTFWGEGAPRPGALPLVLPPVVGGIALLYTFGRRGLLGADVRGVRRDDRVLDHGRRARADVRGAAVPRVRVEGALRTVGTRYEAVAATLGAARLARSFAGSRCRWWCPAWSPAPCCRSPAPSASSARRSPSRAASRASLAPSRSRCTSSARRTPTRRSRCRSSSSSWPCSWSRSPIRRGEPGGLRWRSAP